MLPRMVMAEAMARVEALELEIGRERAENRRQRAEVATLRAENTTLRTENLELQQLLTEARATVGGQAVRIAELERRLNQTSRNSSKPPSSDGPAAEPPAPPP